MNPNPSVTPGRTPLAPGEDPEFGRLGPANLPQPIDTQRYTPIWSSLDYDGRFQSHFHAFRLNLTDFKGAILDLDGFLVNSEKPIVRCIMLGARDLIRERLDDTTAPLPDGILTRIREEALGNADTKMSVIVRRILAESDLLPPRAAALAEVDFIRAFSDIRRDHFLALIRAGEFRELAGAVAFVRKLSAHFNGRVSILTGSQREYADLEITALGLDSALPPQYRVTASDLPPGSGKPDPRGFTMAKAKLGLGEGDPWIAAGDRWKDMAGALSAGGCEAVIVVAEDMNEQPFQAALLDFKSGRERFFDGTALTAAAKAERDRVSEFVHHRVIFVTSLDASCLELTPPLTSLLPGGAPP